MLKSLHLPVPLAGTALAVSAILALAAPAAADTVVVKDPADTGHGSDLRRVKVDYTPDAVTIVTKHTDLRRAPATGSGGAVFIDTDPDDRGPEFVVAGGYFAGTDYALVHTDGFATAKWGDHVDSAFELDIHYRRDKVVTVIPVETLELADDAQVRVAVRASGTRTDGSRKGLTDWLGERREFTDWLSPS